MSLNLTEIKNKKSLIKIKKPEGCPADGIEGFRMFMIGQKELPVSLDLIPLDIMS